MIPSVGRTVLYTLDASDVSTIQARRIRDNCPGNPVSVGRVFPLIISCVWGEPATETTCVNGQVILDGPDQLWVTSRQQGEGEGTWADPRAVAGNPVS